MAMSEQPESLDLNLKEISLVELQRELGYGMKFCGDYAEGNEEEEK
jgi:hypothetical protein